MTAARKVFIVDDDEVVLESLRQLLTLSGFEVESTSDSREALVRIKAARPHMILLDLLMPHLGGFEVCEMLNRDPATRDIPIIIISAIGGFTDVKRAYKLGVVGYFTKPYDFKELLKEISKDIYYKERA